MNVRKFFHFIALMAVFFAAGTPAGGAVPALAASLPATLQFTLITGGLSSPVFVTNAGDGSHRLFIVQQSGQIRIVKSGGLLPNPFLNISGLVSDFTGMNGEQGLLALAFDPQYITNGFFYITYTTNTGAPTFKYTTTLARYHVSSNADVADPSSGTVLLSIPKKFTNHNGGMIAFGPDEFLYMSMGDGGSGGDPDDNAQNLSTLLGKLLRLDVTSTPPAGQKYVVPPTNPFFGNSDPNVKQEIWATGLRNPWRFSFDPSTGDLYIGDVGQNVQEEVDFQPDADPGGQNYGWKILEGNRCYSPSAGCVPPSSYVAPVATYNHGTNDSIGCAIIGGSVYRGSTFSELYGVYLYGDYCSGKVWGLVRNPDTTWTSGLIIATNYSISSFGQDEGGEPYLTDYGTGNLYRISAPGVPVISQVYPSDGSQVCRRPPIGAYFVNVVPSGGTLDPSAFVLTLDGVDVTASAGILQPMLSPASNAQVMFTPTTDLVGGPHQAVATYTSASGPISNHWQFTVVPSMDCATSLQESPTETSDQISEPALTPTEIVPTRIPASASVAAPTDGPVESAAPTINSAPNVTHAHPKAPIRKPRLFPAGPHGKRLAWPI